MFGFSKTDRVTATNALAGRGDAIATAEQHFVFNRPLNGDIPQGMDQAMFGMGCFWGVERIFWQLDGIWMTRVGYSAGFTPNPTYQELCTGQTGHNEVVHLVFDPAVISYGALLKAFWQGHDPTQGMGQGNDRGTQYRSGIYTYGEDQALAAAASRDLYNGRLSAAGIGLITTEILPAPVFYHAEAAHQQYLAKNPGGYCGLGGTGVSCPIGVGTA
ncbi:MAG: peptide-methionine (S)-S-oxide reductase MsrA [Paracoccaceae bacterium]